MTEDYVARRRQYVEQIRRSFDETPAMRQEIEQEMPTIQTEWLFFKIRIVLSTVILIVFLLCLFYDKTIYGFQAQDILDKISEDRYAAILQGYLKSPFP